MLLPALRADMASIPLPTGTPAQPDTQIPNTTRNEPSWPPCFACPPEGTHTGMDIDSDSSQTTAAVAAKLKQTSDSSTASSTDAKAVDENPIRPKIQQTSSGSCVSPIMGRRTTVFSSSSASSLDSEGLHSASDQPESRQLTGQQASTSQARPYLTCCVRLSPEKEPHRQVLHNYCSFAALN